MNLKLKSVQKVALQALTFGAATIVAQPSYSQADVNSDRTFYCGTFRGVPATMVRRGSGDDISLIRWNTNYGGFSAQSRCQTVSDRFESEYKIGRLSYVTTGRIGRQPVICTAASQGGSCVALLFTLRMGDDGNAILRQLFEIRTLSANAPIEQSTYMKPESVQGEIRYYVDVFNYIRVLDRVGK
ncbi:COP23 domain-containing protein [Floridanema evergladense]|uniref:COP23 domain-containing protein n=1 Tax=Floridaenema evergladense BLCC-F167 TaxID=3153639 RepID=A0ABV4WS48_9CYAN